jgi:hypothetical protein
MNEIREILKESLVVEQVWDESRRSFVWTVNNIETAKVRLVEMFKRKMANNAQHYSSKYDGKFYIDSDGIGKIIQELENGI